MGDPVSDETRTRRRVLALGGLRRALPPVIVVLAAGAVALSVWTLAAEDEPSWVSTVGTAMAWAAVAGIGAMVAISRRSR